VLEYPRSSEGSNPRNAIKGPDRKRAFAQQSAPVFLAVQRDLVLLFEELHPRLRDHHTEWARDATEPAGLSLIGRYIDDCGPTPLRGAWYRICCTSKSFREYEQPYFAVHE
jgi:hypothetical protein